MLTYTGPKCIMTAEGTHDITRTYEALDVVYDSATGNSYVAKIDVPANTPLTNTTYWNVSANPNQAVSELQSAVSTLQTSMTTAQSDIIGKVNKSDVLTTKQQVIQNLSAGKLVDAQVLKDAVKLEVEDNLNSTSTTNALSANQGKVLNTALSGKADKSSVKSYGDCMASVDTSDIASAKALKDLKDGIFYFVDVPFSVSLETAGHVYYTSVSYSKPEGYNFLDAVMTTFSIPHVALPSVSAATENSVTITVYNGYGNITATGTVRVILMKA